MLSAVKNETATSAIFTLADLQRFLAAVAPFEKGAGKIPGLVQFHASATGGLRISYTSRLGALELTPSYHTGQFPAFSVPVRELSQSVKALASGFLTVDWSCGMVSFSTDGTSFSLSKITCDYAKEIPDYPTGSDAFPAAAIRESFPALLKIADSDSPRNYGTVVAIQATDRVTTFCATDGFRLAYTESPRSAGFIGDICIPVVCAAAMLTMAKAIGLPASWGISEDKTTLRVTDGCIRAYFRTSAVKYPNWRGIIPNGKGTRFTLPVKTLLAATKAALVTTNKSRRVVLTRNSDARMVILSRVEDGKDKTSNSEAVPAGPYSLYAVAGADWLGANTHVNGKFLVDTLTAKGEKEAVCIVDSDPEAPITFHIGAVTTILVPVRSVD